MDRGHTQRPHVGEIYGVGDFVFIPDIAKKQQAMNEEVNRLQSEIDRLEALKVSARQLESKAQLREIEREQLLKQASLKQAQLKQQASEREARLREQALAEEQRQLAEAEQRKQQQSYQLAMLTQKAEKLRKEVGSPATALGIDDAIKEIKEINSALNKLETEFSSESTRQVKPVRQFYDSKMKKIYDKRNQPKSMYETDSDYKKRVAQFDSQISEIKSEMDLKISDIRQKIDNELRQQKKPLLNQRAEITKQVFPIGIGNVSFKLGFYDAEKQQFDVSFEIKEKKLTLNAFALLPIPKKKAAQYGKYQQLLVPDVNIKLNDEAELISGKFSFSGLEKGEYNCKSIIWGVKKGRFIIYNNKIFLGRLYVNRIILDTQTNLMWASWDNGVDISWYRAKRYCDNFQGGEYTGWRIPGINELKELYRADYKGIVTITDCCVWAAKTNGRSAPYFNFNSGISKSTSESFGTNKRSLPVRGGKN